MSANLIPMPSADYSADDARLASLIAQRLSAAVDSMEIIRDDDGTAIGCVVFCDVEALAVALEVVRR